jgi:predicted transcriptional regulator
MTIELPDDLGAWLQKVASQEEKDISVCAAEKIQQQLRLDTSPQEESVLLARIHAPLASPERERRDALLAISDRTKAQEAELQHLIEIVETAHAQRWQDIAQLGQLNGKNVVVMAKKFGITHRKYEIVEINTIGYGYSEIHVMIDCEMDDREMWTEYLHQGKPLRLNDGDIILHYP